MEKILLVGGGGHCRSVIDVIEEENRFQVAGIVDRSELLGSKVLDYEVIGCDDDLKMLSKTYKYALVTVGQIRSSELRVKLFTTLKELGFILPTVISPRSYISKYAELGEGTVVMHDVLINASVKIGTNCIINTKSLIEHDSIIEANCHISTGAIINGGVKVEANSFVGSNTTTKEAIIIKKNSFIKAGSIVK